MPAWEEIPVSQSRREIMKEQIIQILERDVCAPGPSVWKVRTVIQLWPNIPEERTRLNRFIEDDPNEPKIAPVEDAELLQKQYYCFGCDARCYIESNCELNQTLIKCLKPSRFGHPEDEDAAQFTKME
jgi:hypothetical protein